MSQSLTPLQFDSLGYLVPDQPISVSLDLFRETFEFNEHRRELLAQHNELLTGLRELGIVGVEQWVNGSFVTQKSLPNDIDVLTFVPVELHQSLELELRALFATYPNVDAYAVRVFPESHRQYFLTNLY
jgi:hypothetical protein